MPQIKAYEATNIVNALTGGVVPSVGIHHITVGRSLETQAIIKALKDVEAGHGLVKFWIGDFGSGKSFILQLIKSIAIQKGFVVVGADFTPSLRLYDNGGKAVALYSQLIHGLSTKDAPNGQGLSTLLDGWLEKCLDQVAEANSLSRDDLLAGKHPDLLSNHIIETCRAASNFGGYELGLVIAKYLEGFISGNDQLKQQALKWLMGEYTTLTEARQDLGVRIIINDSNYYDMLKNLGLFFKRIGYLGLVVNLDEAVNLYKITQTPARDKNYEKLLSIYNDCLQGGRSHMFFNFAGTCEFLENERKGLFSYQALKTRLADNNFADGELRDYDQPVLRLKPLDDNEVFQLLKTIQKVFGTRYKGAPSLDSAEIQQFMEKLLSRVGGSQLLMPRETTRQFLDLLNLLRQNPDSKQDLLARFKPAAVAEVTADVEIV